MKALESIPFRKPCPKWEPGWWQVTHNVGVSYFGNAWHVVRFRGTRVQVWDYGSGKKALRDARRLARGKGPMAEPDLELIQ